MNAEDAGVVEAVRAESAAIARAIEWTADRFRRGGRLIYVGAGTSGRLGVLDASECPPTFGTPPEMVVGLIAGGPSRPHAGRRGGRGRPGRGAADLAALGVASRDLVVGIATSGRTPYVLGAVREARSRGAATVGIACNRPSLLGRGSTWRSRPWSAPEIIAGSTRLKAGTATKMVLNMITTGAMVRIGKTLGNRMIDLQPTNEKLRHPHPPDLRELAGVDDDRAAEILRLRRPAQARPGGGAARRARRTRRRRCSTPTADRSARRSWPRRESTHDDAGRPVLLGIDGGGTSTVALLADADGVPIGQGRGRALERQGGRCRGREAGPRGRDRPRRFADAGLVAQAAAVACLGWRASTGPRTSSSSASGPRRGHWAERLVLVNDGDLVIAAGTPDGWGVGVIAGTGSIAVGRDAGWPQSRAGGWGT